MALTPFQSAFAGQCDATGKGTIAIQGSPVAWVAIYLPVEVSGTSNPVWVIRQGSAGAPIIFGSGTQTQLGPIVLSPNENCTINISGATANATVDGQMLGWQAFSPSELPPALPAPASINISGGNINATISSGTVTISGTPTVQFAAGQNVSITAGTINVQNVPGTSLQTLQSQTATVTNWVIPLDGASHSQVAAISAGQHSIGITLNPAQTGSFSNFQSITCVGNNTLVDYAKTQSIAPTGVLMLPVFSAQDTQVTVTVVTNNVGGNAKGTITAIFDVETISISPQQPANVANPQIPLATYTLNRSGFQSKTLVVPVGVQGISINPATIGTNFTFVSIVGGTTSTLYFQNFNRQSFVNRPIIALVNPGIESSFTINFSYSGTTAGTDTWYVGGILGNQIVQQVAAYGYAPAAWQAPQTYASQETGDGAQHTVVADPGNGQQIYLFGWCLEIDGAAALRACTLQVVPGGGRLAFLEAQNGQISGFAGGLPLGPGNHLDLVVTTANGENARAFVGYSTG